jgi:hypothetical protein
MKYVSQGHARKKNIYIRYRIHLWHKNLLFFSLSQAQQLFYNDHSSPSSTHIYTIWLCSLLVRVSSPDLASRMVGDEPDDSEALVVTSSISRFPGPTQFFGGAHRGRVCVRMFIGVSVHSYMCVSVYVCNWVSQKNVHIGDWENQINGNRGVVLQQIEEVLSPIHESAIKP